MPLTDLIEVMRIQLPNLMRSDGAFTVLTPIDASGFGKLWQVKNQQGFPWDVILFDKLKCWDRATERDKEGWGNPEDFKLHTGSGGRGTLIGPRFIPNGFPTDEYVTEKATYEPFFNGQIDLVSHDVGRARTIWQYVDSMDWGGDVGKRPGYIRNYQWSGQPDTTNGLWRYTMLEVYKCVPPYGPIQWTEHKLNPATGLYEVSNPGPGLLNTFKPMKVAPIVKFPRLKAA